MKIKNRLIEDSNGDILAVVPIILVVIVLFLLAVYGMQALSQSSMYPVANNTMNQTQFANVQMMSAVMELWPYIVVIGVLALIVALLGAVMANRSGGGRG